VASQGPEAPIAGTQIAVFEILNDSIEKTMLNCALFVVIVTCRLKFYMIIFQIGLELNEAHPVDLLIEAEMYKGAR
jgi:hypothetical protein